MERCAKGSKVKWQNQSDGKWVFTVKLFLLFCTSVMFHSKV